jgi:hypothetical protein
MTMIICAFVLVGIVVFQLFRTGGDHARRKQAGSIDAMHPTLLMAHTLANRQQKSYVLVRDLMTRGVSIVPEARMHIDEGFEVVAVVHPIPIGEEYDPKPINWAQRKRQWRARQRAKMRGLDEACVH